MIEAYYGELDIDRRQAFENHLHSCPACAAEHKEVSSTLDSMSAYTRPEPDGTFWQSFDERLMERINREEVTPVRPAIRRSRAFRYMRTLSAAAALFIAGLLLGQIWAGRQHSAPEHAALTPQPSGEITAGQAAREYLNQAEIVLLGMINCDIETEYTYRPNFTRQKQISRDLVNESAELKVRLAETNRYQLLDLVEDLEVILLQIAALETDYSIEDIELIQNSAERRAILFKLTVDEIMTEKTHEDKTTSSDTMKTNAI